MGGIGRLIDQIARIISNPGSNLAGAMLLLAMVVLVLLILAIGALITILPSGDDEDDGEARGDDGDDDDELEGDEPEARERGSAPEAPEGEPGEETAEHAEADNPEQAAHAGPRVWSLALPIVLLAAATLSAWYVTGQPSSCGSCHATAPSLKSWRAGDHSGVRCVACHEDSGLGLPAAVAQRATDAYANVAGGEADGARRPVPSRRCLRCHRNVLRGVLTTRAVRVSHAEFLSRGYDCIRCHEGVGHSPASALSRAVGMGHCVGCHDGKTASSACGTCHEGDPSTAVRVDRALYPTADITPPRGCRGCHQTKTCDDCHGIEMPHPEGFETAKGHARAAAFEAKELCWRCHEKQDCRRCHRGDFGAHGPNWKVQHDHGRLDGRETCACHTSSNFCGLCHQTGKR